jgi:hypothetical protein
MKSNKNNVSNKECIKACFLATLPLNQEARES